MIRMGPTKFAAGLCCTLLMVMALGCARSAPSRVSYLLAASRQGPPAPTVGQGILEVRRFSIDAEFAGRGLVYRTDEYTFERDAYREFLVSPAQMITGRVSAWLSLSGLFEQVLVPGSRVLPTHTLEGNILALYADLRDADAPTAVLELRCFLIAGNDGPEKVLFARNYRSVKPLERNTAEALVAAFDACLIEILTNLERGLAEAVPEIYR